MEILGEIRNSENEVLFTIYRSDAKSRKGVFRIHHHIECELGYILNGKGIYQAKRNYEINTGDFFYYGSNEAHCITDIENGDMSIINLHISPQYFRMLHSIGLKKDNLGALFFRLKFRENKLNEIMDEKDLRKIAFYIEEIISEFREQNENYIFMAESHLNALLTLLSRYADSSDQENTVSQESSEIIFRSMDYINEHFEEALSLDLLSKEVGLEKTYYAALFKRTVGMTPWEYLSLKRIDEALNLLRNTHENVLAIALKCGYGNTASFNSNFKKYTGLTPKQVREK